ncbi:MAG: xanthine dehydrogenase family protein subunit M [Firmicutes bacterium]|nr:xanthine dehydrogenase family protein subunit M [Bacillota bacterium]MDH7495675.1 xanthine dehydrogenase family protein subunit M [Bacillota bacterium]
MLLPFDYVRARSREEAVDLAIRAGAGGRFLAGGTDLLVRIHDRQLRPQVLIDLKGIVGIQAVSPRAGGGLVVGAATPLNRLISHEAVRAGYGLLAEAAHTVGSVQIRNRASLGGNISNASPAADTAPALLLYEAEIVTWGQAGERRIPISEFFKGPGATALSAGEFVFQVELPALKERSFGTYLKLGRTGAVDLSIVSVAALALEGGEVRLALGAVAPTPVRVREAEAILRNRKDQHAIREAAAAARRFAEPISDIRASKEYRLEMTEVLSARAIEQALRGLEAGAGARRGDRP